MHRLMKALKDFIQYSNADEDVSMKIDTIYML